MAIDGYIIYTDTADIKAFTRELSAIGRNISSTENVYFRPVSSLYSDVMTYRSQDKRKFIISIRHLILLSLIHISEHALSDNSP